MERMIIGHQRIKEGINDLVDLVRDAHTEINQAYLDNDDDVPITMKLRYRRNKRGEVEMGTGIDFVQTRYKRNKNRIVEEDQRRLPGMD